MLNGLPPFYDEDVQEMYTKILSAELQIPDFIRYPSIHPFFQLFFLPSCLWEMLIFFSHFSYLPNIFHSILC